MSSPYYPRSGSVWQCPLTQSTDDCSPIEGIVPGSSVPPSRDEIRNDQWLGVAVTSQGPGTWHWIFINSQLINTILPGGKVMVCAHRYTRRGLDYRWGQGQCFTLTNRLQFDETWEPCRGRDTYRWENYITYKCNLWCPVTRIINKPRCLS